MPFSEGPGEESGWFLNHEEQEIHDANQHALPESHLLNVIYSFTQQTFSEPPPLPWTMEMNQCLNPQGSRSVVGLVEGSRGLMYKHNQHNEFGAREGYTGYSRSLEEMTISISRSGRASWRKSSVLGF